MVELGAISIRDENSIVHCRNKIRVLAVDLNFTFVQATRIATASSEICWSLLDNENNSCVDVYFDKMGERFGLLLVFQGVSTRFKSMKNEFLFDQFTLIPGDHGKQNIHAFKFFPDPTFIPPRNFIEAEKNKINQLSREELIGELSRAKELAESASLITQSTIDNMGQGIFMVDAEGNVLVCNDVLLEYLNISREQAKSLQKAEDFRTLGRQNFLEEDVERSVNIARGGGAFSYDITTLDGKVLGVSQNTIPGGGFVRTYTDITERKQTETALIEQSALIKLLRTTASEANSATKFKEAIQSCLTTVCNHTDWPVGHAYFLSNEDDGILVSSGIWHLDDPKKFTTFVETTEKSTFKAGIGLPGRVLESHEPAWIVDVTKDPNFPRTKLAEDINVRGAFAFPVLSRDKVVGVLEFFDEKATELNESLLATVTQIGSQLGRVFERQQTEEKLRGSERQFRELLESSPIGVSIITRDDRLIFFKESTAGLSY